MPSNASTQIMVSLALVTTVLIPQAALGKRRCHEGLRYIDCPGGSGGVCYAGTADGRGKAAFPGNNPVVYLNWQTFRDSGFQDSERDAFEDAIRAAVARWRQAPTPLTPVYGGVDNSITRHNVGDDEVVILMDKEVLPFDGSATGHAFHRWHPPASNPEGLWRDDDGNVIGECDLSCQNGPDPALAGVSSCVPQCGTSGGSFILYNGHQHPSGQRLLDWQPFPQREPGEHRFGYIDFGAVTMHELGHAWGLCHEMEATADTAAMNPSNVGDVKFWGVLWGPQRYGPYFNDFQQLQEYYGADDNSMYTRRSTDSGQNFGFLSDNMAAAEIFTRMEPGMARNAEASSELLLGFTYSGEAMAQTGKVAVPCFARGTYNFGSVTYEPPLCCSTESSTRGVSIDRVGDTIMIVWVSRFDQVQVMLSTNGGVAWHPRRIPGAPRTMGTPSVRALPTEGGSQRWVIAWAHFDEFDPMGTGQIRATVTTDNGQTFTQPANLSAMLFGQNYHTEHGVSIAAFDSSSGGQSVDDLVYVAFVESSDTRRWLWDGAPYHMRTMITGYRPAEPSSFLYGGHMIPPNWRTYYRPQLRATNNYLIGMTANSEFSSIDSTYVQTGRAEVARTSLSSLPSAWQSTYKHLPTSSQRMPTAPALAGTDGLSWLFMAYDIYVQ